MPLSKKELTRLAGVGAKARLEELDRERELILKTFPELCESPEATPTTSAPKRRRRKMTAAQRKAVGLRMKAYWAAKRAKGAAKK